MTTTQQLDLDTPSDFVSDGALDALGGRKAVNKPDISRLPDAFVGGIAQFKEGDKLVIERYASFLTGKPYLDTKTFRVERYDMATGRIHLFDEALDQNAMMDWHSAVKCGTVFKLAVGKVDISTKKKRGRPRKNPVEAPKEEAPQGEKRGRGRPKGAKNRAKEVIAAEKQEKKAKRAAKVAKRKPKKKVGK